MGFFEAENGHRTMIFHDDCLKFLRNLESDSLDSLVTDPPAGIAFMGKDWDKDKGGRSPWVAWMTEVMRECLRVLKPGAHGLVWALPRTSHWTATALEDAGFEVRDVVTHLFGTGFPKSLDVSKAIDKAAGAKRIDMGPNPHKIGRTKDMRGGRLVGNGEADMEAICRQTSPSTDAAKQWQGWGTALKPASEHWVLVRKPCAEKTVAANVLKHGTGAVNIDGCRIEGVAQLRGGGLSNRVTLLEGGDRIRTDYQTPAQGRFPANLLLSHNHDCEEVCTPGCAVAELDGQSGTLKSGNLSPGHKQSCGTGNSIQTYGGQSRIIQKEYGGDSGGASRFFYCAKASKRDRGEGNVHPTVKSTQLMRYLCRLVTPPGGIVLDPFAGSGSTGVAALAEDFRFVGVEQEAEYAAIAKTRLEAAGGRFG